MPGRAPRRDQAPHEDNGAAELSPEQALIAAMLRCAVQDARSQARATQADVHRRVSAQQWLRDRQQVEWSLTLVGLPESSYARLLREAGIEDNPVSSTE